MTLDYNLGIQNIVNGQGVSIALTGMLIVFTALSLITIFIALLPKILGIPADSKSSEDEVVAAIGYTLYRSISKKQPGKQKDG